MTNRRIVQHTDSHYDIEETRAVLAESGEIVGCEWAVIFCSEDEMYNGWTPTIPQEVRIANLLNQVPQEYRARATRECYGENDHEFERKLTGYVIMRIWETYEHPVNEAEVTFTDPRTEAEKLADADWQDEQQTRRDVYSGFGY